MKPHLQLSLTAFLVCGAMWLFQDTLISVVLDEDHLRKTIIDSMSLTVGVHEKCQAEVHLSSWPELNQIQIYRWVVACEDAALESKP